MKKILSAVLAVTLITSAGAAVAAPNDNRHDQQMQRLDKQVNKAERKADRADDRYERKAAKRYAAGRYQRPNGYQQRQWRHGDRLPASYRGKGYAVDYRRYGLQAPPRGYQYTRVDNDVVLTAVATGLITSVIVGLFQ